MKEPGQIAWEAYQARVRTLTGLAWGQIAGERQKQWAVVEAAVLAAAQARADTAERNLANILARIHRDGGHYHDQHGTLKACVDADLIVSGLFQRVDEAEAAQARIAVLETALTVISDTNAAPKKVYGEGLYWWAVNIARAALEKGEVK